MLLYSLDLETCCNVPSCPDYGKSICRNDHSLSPWHGRITQLACWSPSSWRVVQGEGAALELVRVLLGKPGAKLVGHSMKFDLLWLSVKAPGWAERLREAWVADTNLMAFVHTNKIPDQWIAEYVANAPAGNRKAGKHSLKTLAPYFLGVEPYWESTSGGHESEEYVLKDVEYTYRLYQYLLANMTPDESAFVNERLLPWAKMCLEAELAGMRLDVTGLLAYQEELRAKEASLRSQLDDMWNEAHAAYHNIQLAHVHSKYDAMKPTKAREPRRQVALARVPTQVDYDSPAQMRWLLADFYGYDVRSLEGNETTGKEVLNRLADEGHDDVRTYLEWRKTQKVLTAFIPGLLEQADERGYVHAIFNITGTRTGRLSCERPNLQQTPKELKRFFLPDEGEVIIGRDAKAIEAKLIGLYLQDPVFLDIVMSGKSFHDFNAKAFFNLPCEVSEVSKLYPKERRAAKTLGFSLIFSAGVNRVHIALNQAGFSVTKNEAKRIYTNYRELYKKAFEASKEVIEHFESGGQMTNLMGRPLTIENPEDAYMKSTNLLVQSSASDYNLQQALNCVNELKNAGIKAKPRLFIHDFIAISVPKAKADKACDIVRDILNNFTVDTAAGKLYLDYDGEGFETSWN